MFVSNRRTRKDRNEQELNSEKNRIDIRMESEYIIEEVKN